MFMDGNYRNAALWRAGTGGFWIYREDLEATFEMPAPAVNYWATQSFSDKVVPLTDAAVR